MPDCNTKPKFKKGDKVRRLSGTNSTTPIGYEGVIREVHWDHDEWEYRFEGGGWGYAGLQDERWELVQPVGPVVTETVTKTRIVPGTYGCIQVLSERNGNAVQVIMCSNGEAKTWYTPDELDAAAAVLSALAKGLRDA